METRKEKIKKLFQKVIYKDGDIYVFYSKRTMDKLINDIAALPIEVPSDEEIKEESLNGQINLHDHNWMNWLNDEEQGLFIMAAKWAINKTIERNKKCQE